MKPIFLFDIDLTLLDTISVRKIVHEKLRELVGASREEFSRVESEFIKTLELSSDFNPDGYLDHLTRYFQVELSQLESTFYDQPEVYVQGLYLDVVPALKKLRLEHTLGVFSEGFEKFQTHKLKESGLIKFFDQKHFYIFRRKLTGEVLGSLPAGSFIIDDSLKVIDWLVESDRPDLVPIWLNRKSEERHPQALTVYNLEDLYDVLKN